MNFKKILALSFALLFVFLTIIIPLPVSAPETPQPSFETDGKSACVYDVTHSQFIYKKNADEVLNTSTSAKIMMGLIACEQLADRLNEKITVTEKMISGVGGYSMKLKVGETVTVKDLLYGAICASYNDAAYVLASVCGGSADGFVERRQSDSDKRVTCVFPTERAKEILPFVKKTAKAWNEFLLSCLSPDEQSALMSSLEKICKKAQSYVNEEMTPKDIEKEDEADN
jgi:beta-lactamase class A